MPSTAPSGADDNQPPRRLQTCHVDDLLFFMAKTAGASDLYLSVGLPPIVRVDGKLWQAFLYEPVTAETSERLVFQILTEQQIREFGSGSDLGFTYSARRIGEFSVRVFDDNGTVASNYHTIK